VAGPASAATSEARLLDEYAAYDQAVDVVSALEWMFTAAKDLPQTVAHFERFPRIPRDDGEPLTPDFTVLFTDGTAIVGEIAQIALHENSVDKLCKQIANYDALRHVPNSSGGMTPIEVPDVLQLVRAQNGLAALRRIIADRYLNPDHPYKPSRPPCVAQFSRTEAVYSFQRLPSEDNGKLSAPPGRTPNIGEYLDNDLPVKAGRFVALKARRAFINDPVDALYLATHLWSRTLPTLYGSGKDDIAVEVGATVKVLQDQYGHARTGDVKRALELLEASGLAAANDDGTWTVSRRLLGRAGDRDVHKIIARKAATGAKRLVVRKPTGAENVPDTLF